jgi:hypothetical protein
MHELEIVTDEQAEATFVLAFWFALRVAVTSRVGGVRGTNTLLPIAFAPNQRRRTGMR